MVIIKAFDCSVSTKQKYIIVNESEIYKVKDFHNNRIALESNIKDIVWIEDNGYELKSGDNIKITKHDIRTIDEYGYIVTTKDHKYETRLKDIKDNNARNSLTKSIITSCEELRKSVRLSGDLKINNNKGEFVMTFDFEIQKCEHCGEEYLIEEFMSGNTFGMMLRSDGKRIGGCMGEPTVVFKCKKCDSINWLIDKKSQSYEYRTSKETKLIPSLSIELCEEIISNNLYYDLKTEKYIRIKYWHLCNDNAGGTFDLDNNKLLIGNLECLLIILKEDSSIDSQFLRCEILRELGLFKEAKEVLLKIRDFADGHIVGLFEQMIDDNDKKVKILF